jgi:hypothetical protein
MPAKRSGKRMYWNRLSGRSKRKNRQFLSRSRRKCGCCMRPSRIEIAQCSGNYTTNIRHDSRERRPTTFVRRIDIIIIVSTNSAIEIILPMELLERLGLQISLLLSTSSEKFKNGCRLFPPQLPSTRRRSPGTPKRIISRRREIVFGEDIVRVMSHILQRTDVTRVEIALGFKQR